MATYQYKARDKSGKLVSGVMGAESENAVAVKLKQMQFLPLTIIPKKEGVALGDFFRRFARISFAEINMFTRQLCTLQRAGLPILRSINAIAEQAENKKFKTVIEQLGRDISAGTKLSDGLKKYPQIFNKLYVNMIEAGEASGKLPETLDRIATLGEHDEKIRMRINAAMRYPFIVVGAMVLGFLILISYVVPVAGVYV